MLRMYGVVVRCRCWRKASRGFGTSMRRRLGRRQARRRAYTGKDVAPGSRKVIYVNFGGRRAWRMSCGLLCRYTCKIVSTYVRCNENEGRADKNKGGSRSNWSYERVYLIVKEEDAIIRAQSRVREMAKKEKRTQKRT
jgi:hypothetical protein